MIKTLVLGVFLVAATVAGTLFFNQSKVTIDSSPTAESLQKIAQLAGLKVIVSDILSVDESNSVMGLSTNLFSGIKGVWVVKGDALLSTDMKKSKITLNKESKLISITLQEPQVLSPRVDHEKTKQFSFKSGLFVSQKRTAALHQKAMKHAQRAILKGAGLPEYKNLAKQNIETLLKSLVQLSYTDWSIDINWVKG